MRRYGFCYTPFYIHIFIKTVEYAKTESNIAYRILVEIMEKSLRRAENCPYAGFVV